MSDASDIDIYPIKSEYLDSDTVLDSDIDYPFSIQTLLGQMDIGKYPSRFHPYIEAKGFIAP